MTIATDERFAPFDEPTPTAAFPSLTLNIHRKRLMQSNYLPIEMQPKARSPESAFPSEAQVEAQRVDESLLLGLGPDPPTAEERFEFPGETFILFNPKETLIPFNSQDAVTTLASLSVRKS